MRSDSAQMTLDYLAGIGIFLVAVFFVYQFVSNLFIPFQSSSDEATLAADRASTTLVEQMLHEDTTGELNVINQSKLLSFNASDPNMLSALGLFPYFDLNVTVTNLTSANRPMNQSGPPVPTEYTDVGRTNRTVLIINSSTGYNQTAILSVSVW